MITVTGKIEDAAGVVLHATVDFLSKSTPLVAAGIITTNTDKTIRSNPSDGTFAVELAPGNYTVTITANGLPTTFTITVPEGNTTASIETLVSTPLAFTFTPPNAIWNGTRAGHITFLPTAPPPAPTTSEVAYPGGVVDGGNNHYSYFVSYITQTGETVVSPVLAVALTSGSPVADKANRIFLQVNPSGVTSVRIWRTYVDPGHAYDVTTFPSNVGLLATVDPTAAYYDDWESTADFATRVDATIVPTPINTTAGELLSSPGNICAQVTDQGLAVVAPLIVKSGASFPGGNVRFTQGVGLELYNFDTQLWYTLISTGNPAQLGLSTGHA